MVFVSQVDYNCMAFEALYCVEVRVFIRKRVHLGYSFLSVISLPIVGWFARCYFPNYMKGKNTAAKEGIEEITKIVD